MTSRGSSFAESFSVFLCLHSLISKTVCAVKNACRYIWFKFFLYINKIFPVFLNSLAVKQKLTDPNFFLNFLSLFLPSFFFPSQWIYILVFMALPLLPITAVPVSSLLAPVVYPHPWPFSDDKPQIAHRHTLRPLERLWLSMAGLDPGRSGQHTCWC